MTSFKMSVATPSEEGLLWSDVVLVCPQFHRFSLIKAVRKGLLSREEASITYCQALEYRQKYDELIDAKAWSTLHTLLMQQGLTTEDATLYVDNVKSQQ